MKTKCLKDSLSLNWQLCRPHAERPRQLAPSEKGFSSPARLLAQPEWDSLRARCLSSFDAKDTEPFSGPSPAGVFSPESLVGPGLVQDRPPAVVRGGPRRGRRILHGARNGWLPVIQGESASQGLDERYAARVTVPTVSFLPKRRRIVRGLIRRS